MAKVFNVLEGENLTAAAKTTGIGILELSTVFDSLSPDIVVTVADRYETMATAISAAYMNIPLAHIQGGEVTGNIDEKVRHAITKLADYHFVASEGARERVIKMGEDPEFVFNTGCPSIDIAAGVLEDFDLDIDADIDADFDVDVDTDIDIGFDPYEKYGGVGAKPDYRRGYIVLMQHPVTTEYRESRRHIEETLYAVKDIGLPVFCFWPNVDAGADGTSNGIRAFREKYQVPHFHFFKNMEPVDFLRLLYHSKCLVGNSSVGIRECAYMAVPVVNIGSRQNRRDRGHNVLDVGYNRHEIRKAILSWMRNGKPIMSEVYGGGNAGQNIAKCLSSVPLKIDKAITY